MGPSLATRKWQGQQEQSTGYREWHSCKQNLRLIISNIVRPTDTGTRSVSALTQRDTERYTERDTERVAETEIGQKKVNREKAIEPDLTNSNWYNSMCRQKETDKH